MAADVEGALALYTYTDVYHDKNGRHETDYPFTVSLIDLSETAAKIEGLYCNRKSGFSFLEGVEDAFRSNERVSLESEALADEYEIFIPRAGPELDPPALLPHLHRLADRVRAGEVRLRAQNGMLCCSVKGHRKHAAQLDEVRDVDDRDRRPDPRRGRGSHLLSRRLTLQAASSTSELATSPAAMISSTDGTRTSATTSWIFGAARAARSCTARRCRPRSEPAWLRS